MQLKPIIRAIPDITRYKPKKLYDVRKHLADFETLKIANKRRRSLARFLKKYRANDNDLINVL